MTAPTVHSGATTLDYDPSSQSVWIIDQTLLPHHYQRVQLLELEDFCLAIASMQVRGAPLIGITAAFGLALSLNRPQANAEQAYQALLATRPTAINLQWALDKVMQAITAQPATAFAAALAMAQSLREQDIAHCSTIGEHGVALIQQQYQQKQRCINILTHCNAGWLATIQWGTALAPIYKAQQLGIPVHVWVDETRPRNQGAHLTAWELQQAGIAHTIICDNTGGHLMQQGMVDMCIVGSDRTSANGDVCNKIGTYLKALAAHDNHIPFYAAVPSSTIDWQIDDGVQQIPIEQRDSAEVLSISGLDEQGISRTVTVNRHSPAANYGFDVTPARLVSAIITELGVVQANSKALASLREQLP
ncbi:S-methyl-5-thioribose-1-phosphate isomerase [Dasania sp. GY-MA-18]|uniref:Methylthioribose-1-phosphate isomerase n=1 Tax=Dasania phycosphaerae TaxID=2950436 RepID=A0A9J6RHT9_9GAMM|nr:S-methyl-5-thioribose-1-phosphate isomerase [Dasania sp. GY-MA-18]MCZ0864238.1 S-methyl-5-thioribose-1-phosphate isomerase [Dasania phycosphaerae]MCZ0867966.1 S-methyl-5-thioribose-1-phosphate isomerase [Dasania phycosphaerae]